MSMKKLNYLLLGASLLLMASCSQEDVVNPGGDGNVNITINLPGDVMGTRSFGDGYTATNLNYAVYDASTKALVTSSSKTFESNSLSTTVSLNLVNGKSYYIAFFAQSAASQTNGAYSFDAENAKITVDYSKMANYNTDDYDCFFKLYPTGTIGTDVQSTTITLTRPVAQVNWGTDDLTDPAVTNANAYGTGAQYLVSSVTAEAYTTFNMLGENESGDVTGAVSGESTTVNLPNMAAPSGETFPVSPYQYVSMQYLLVPTTSSLTNLTLTVSNGATTKPADVAALSNEIKVTNAPVQANYRTNIYGSLLTSAVNYTVTKDPTWGTPDNNIKLTWDGTTVTYPDITQEQVVVTQPSDLAGLANIVSGTNGQTANTLAGKTIVLSADFDMDGNTLPSIGSTTRSGSAATGTSFQGVIDGNNHTISNLVIKGNGNDSECAGFISNLDGESAALKNLTFDGLTIDAPAADQAGVVGVVTNGATVSNVTVSSGSVTGNQGVGGVVGRVIYAGTVTGCQNNATIKAGTYNAGGIVGAAYYTKSGSTMTISECTNNGSVTGTSNAIAGIVGLSCANVSGCNNNGAITGGSASCGGIVGEQKSAGSVKGCVNTGNVKVNSTNAGNYGAGGIVGWVRYDNSDAYSAQNLIEVSGCTNYASVSGNTGVGGIVGTWYECGLCTGNYNYAPSLSATNQFVAGIIGDSQWTGTYPSSLDPNLILTVSNNSSSTLQTAMSGGAKSDFVYVNNSQKTTLSNNNMVEPQTAP